MFIEPIILSFIVAKLRGGRIRHIEQIDIKGWYLFIFAAIIQFLISLIKGIDIDTGTELLNKYFIYFHAFTYLLLIIGIALNIRANSMKLFLIGIILNLIVILFNGGQMPVSLEGIKGINNYVELPERQFDIKHNSITKDTKLAFLADIIVIPKPYPLPKIISVGDIFIMTGVFLFFQEAMVKENLKRKA
ncbi:DUF5317 domain-containing protein [Proteiniborus sp. MB09-C3]|uniref:DUF5317 domain-containing protein n=1 Tax=Proteiniborus sp. MB09-C3 TaxID=3050072 RepID=UPI002552EEB9|nr:DUF5317 domain-containing protein [Proteiniborus sp. MB09-C3]WIV13828.1 DUF5317 domain-containing protein [Proteiniborus sp. MB09-C3]